MINSDMYSCYPYVLSDHRFMISVYYLEIINYTMNTAPYWSRPKCSDCKRVRCAKGCNCDCHWDRQ